MTLELADAYTLKREPIACVARRGQSSEALDLTLNGGEIVLNLNDHRHVGRLKEPVRQYRQLACLARDRATPRWHTVPHEAPRRGGEHGHLYVLGMWLDDGGAA